MWVVKLGGSLAKSPELPRWIAVLRSHGSGRVVIVPGGGPFADQVREMQNHWRFPDTIAHRMAMRAMEQYGYMLTGLAPGLVPCRSEEEIREQIQHRQVPVWFPHRTVSRSDEIPPTWDVTSDSLAAWLATRLSARHLVLVKSVRLPYRSIAVTELSKRNVVDPAFSRYVNDNLCVWCLHANDHVGMTEMLGEKVTFGTRVLSANS